MNVKGLPIGDVTSIPENNGWQAQGGGGPACGRIGFFNYTRSRELSQAKIAALVKRPFPKQFCPRCANTLDRYGLCPDCLYRNPDTQRWMLAFEKEGAKHGR